MEVRIVMQELTTGQLEERFNEAYHAICDSGTDGYFPVPGLDIDTWIAQEYSFFIDLNGNLCCERDGGEFVWEPSEGEWLQGTFTNREKKERYGR